VSRRRVTFEEGVLALDVYQDDPESTEPNAVAREAAETAGEADGELFAQ
jgi:hypothetical protein